MARDGSFDYRKRFQDWTSPCRDVGDYLGRASIIALTESQADQVWSVLMDAPAGSGDITLMVSSRQPGRVVSLSRESPERKALDRALQSLKEVASPSIRSGPGTAGPLPPTTWPKTWLALSLAYQSNLRGVILVLWATQPPALSAETIERLERLARDIALHAQRYHIRDLVKIKLNREAIAVGASDAMVNVDSFIEKSAQKDLAVLINGEVGTGKEFVAYGIHFASSRFDGPFISVNCAALPKDLAESELFGHIRGSFSGATRDRKGYFEQAHRGTIFLDEIGDLDLPTQTKLLRTIQFGELQTVGGVPNERTSDFRVIAATSHDMQELLASGKFSPALHSRLNLLLLKMPPLRDRAEDILQLCSHFLHKYDPHGSRKLSPEVVRRFQSFDWPANIRQLEGVIARLVTLSDKVVIDQDDLISLVPEVSWRRGECQVEDDVTRIPLCEGVRRLVEDYETSQIESALVDNLWNVKAAAQDLGTSHQNLFKKIKKYQIEKPRLFDVRAYRNCLRPEHVGSI